MKRNTSHIPTSDALNVGRLKPSGCFIEKPQKLRADGRGIATVLNAADTPARNTGRHQEGSGTLGFEHGERKTQKQLRPTIGAPDSNQNTGLARKMLRPCGAIKMDIVPFAVSTSARPAQSFGFRSTSKSTGSHQPCHADVLLEIANED